ncbi:MAG: hypothetical protein RBU30_13075 [Polyangia bacterium]|jgi:hypothetical protein|nr:hypothetical protein [Polyangia bacterium]
MRAGVVTWLLAFVLAVAGGLAGCGDDDSGDSAEEICCSCVENHSCGGAAFSFGACVPDGYHGNVDLTIDATCVAAHCADECSGAQFQ